MHKQCVMSEGLYRDTKQGPSPVARRLRRRGGRGAGKTDSALDEKVGTWRTVWISVGILGDTRL